MHSPKSTIRVIVVLLSGLCFLQIANAQHPSQEQSRSPDKITLQWKFAEGQTTYYTHEEERAEKQIVAGKTYEMVDRLLYRYRWDVVFETESDLAGVGVSFERVRRESVTPERTITTDTYIPLSPKDLSPEKKSQQDEIYRILQTNFVFLASPSRGIAWPEQILTGQQLPSEFRTPTASPFFSPETFTSGDALSMPNRAVKAGDTWASPIKSLSGNAGVGRYRLLGRANRLGHECWQIEGTTTYEPSVGAQGDIASLKVGPRKSMHYFDANIGRLVLSEESTPLQISYVDGRVVETNVRIKRQLAQPPSEDSVRIISRNLADGETQNFLFRGGSPANVDKDWVKVVETGLTLQGTQNLSGLVTVSNLEWFIAFDFSGKKVSSVKLIDVTHSSPIPLDYRELIEDSEDPRYLWFDATEIGSTEAQWFFNDVVTERIVKVAVESDDGEMVTLYQPILVQTLTLRSAEGIVLPTALDAPTQP